jgi:hypothetical protein
MSMPDVTATEIPAAEPASNGLSADPVHLVTPGGAATALTRRPGPSRAWLRFFRSELRIVFGRRRN